MPVKAPKPESDLPQVVAPPDAALILHPLRRLRAEANFLKFPFFDLVRESSKSSRDSIQIRELMPGPNGGKVEVLWQVERSIHSKLPGEFARRLHREVVERIVSDLPRPIVNPVRLGSFSDICRMLELAPSGRTIGQIRTALLCILKTSVQSKSTFYSKVRKTYVEDAFHLYDRVLFAGDALPDGREADAIFVVLGSWYLESVNASYVVPLDFDYFRNLKGSIASRMYELLHHWFFVALRSNQPVVERRYSTLCSYFPLVRQDTLWKAKKQLREAHEQHHERRFLAKAPEWKPVSGCRDDWTLVYTAGPLARDEYRRNQARRNREAIAPDELQTGTQLLLPSPDATLSDVQRDLLHELELRGVTPGIAFQLVEAHPPSLIQEKLEAFDWQMNKADRQITQNPAGYLRASIEQNYAPPAGFVSREERAHKAAEEAAQIQARKAAETKAQKDEQEKRSTLQTQWAALPEHAQLAFRERALAALSDFARKCLQNEEREGRRGAGHATLEAEIHKLLEAEQLATGKPSAMVDKSEE